MWKRIGRPRSGAPPRADRSPALLITLPATEGVLDRLAVRSDGITDIDAPLVHDVGEELLVEEPLEVLLVLGPALHFPAMIDVEEELAQIELSLRFESDLPVPDSKIRVSRSRRSGQPMTSGRGVTRERISGGTMSSSSPR